MKVEELLEAGVQWPVGWKAKLFEFQQLLIEYDDTFELTSTKLIDDPSLMVTADFTRPSRKAKFQKVRLKILGVEDYIIKTYRHLSSTTASFGKAVSSFEEAFIYLDRLKNA